MSGSSSWVQAAIRDQKKDSVESVLIPRITMLKNPKVSRPELAGDTYTGLMELSSKCPHVFGRKVLADALVDLLKWSSGISVPRDGIMQHQLACSLLLAGHESSELWPVGLVQAYLYDALDRRMWVDLQHNSVSTFVANILTAFPGSHTPAAPVDTKTVKEPDAKRMRQHENSPPVPQGAKTPKGSQYFDEEDEDIENPSASGRASPSLPLIRPRFRSAELQSEIARIAIDAVKKQMDALHDATSGDRKLKALVRVLSILVCYEPVRAMVVGKLESWIGNTNLTRYPRELLSRLAASCTLDTNLEHDTMRAVLRMRVKANQTLVEAIATIAKTNIHFLDTALRYYLDIEMFPLETKTLKNKVEITTIFRNAGAPHLSSERPREAGGGLERHPTVDSGIGLFRYQVQARLVRWEAAGAESQSGAMCVALESELLTGAEGDGERILELMECARRMHAAGAAALIVILNAAPRTAAPRSWRPTVELPVVLVPPGEKGDSAAATLMEAAQAGHMGEVVRTPRELILAFNFKFLAVDEQKRLGICPLARKLLRAVSDLDPVVLCQALMEPVDEELARYHPQTRRSWALLLVDLVVFVCFHVATHVQEIAQAPIHADRGAQAGQSDLRVDRAFSRLRTQMRLIQQSAVTWAARTLPQYLTAQDLVTAIEKLLFIPDKDKVSAYNSDALTLESTEKASVQLLITDMPVGSITLGTLIALALPRQATPNTPPSNVGLLPRGHTLDMLEVMVTRAASLAAKRHGMAPGATVEWQEGEDKENINIGVGEEGAGEAILALSGIPHHGIFDLAVPKRFWQACRILILLAAFNTGSLGRLVWQELPTIRCLLVMLITGRFSFPPSDVVATEGGKSGDTEMEEPDQTARWTRATLVSSERMAVLESEAVKADATRVEAGKELVKGLELSENDRDVLNFHIDTAMTVNPRGPPRQPPADVIDKLQEWDRALNLGHILRMSRDPDMLLDTIRAHGSGSAGCVEWLGPVLDRFPSTLAALPEESLCQLLLANLSASSTSSASGGAGGASATAGRQKEVERVVQRLASRLAGKGEEEGKEGGITALLFFVDLVGSGDVAKQDTAVLALNCILEAAVKMRREGDDAMEEEAEDKVEAADKGRWLRLLMQLPCPPQVRRTLSERLRSALFTETDAMLLHHYLIHLSKHLQVGAAELADDVARLVVERRVQVAFLARLEGARDTVQRILLEGLREGKEQADGLVEVAGGRWTDACVVRAALNSLCLPDDSADSEGGSAGAELRGVVLPLASGLGAGLELSESDLMMLLQSADAALRSLGIDTASIAHLVQALRLFGPSAACLAAVVRRLKQADAGATVAAKVGAGSGARVAAMLRGEYDEEAKWLADTLKITLGPAKRLQLPAVSRLYPGLKDVKPQPASTQTTSSQMVLDAADASKRDQGRSRVDGLVKAVEGTDMESAVRRLVLGDSVDREGEMEKVLMMEVEAKLKGLQADLLSAVNPLCGPTAVKVDDSSGRMLARLFAKRQAQGSMADGKAGRSQLASVASSLVRFGLEENVEGCVRWMLERVSMTLPEGEIVLSGKNKEAAADNNADNSAMEVDGADKTQPKKLVGQIAIDARLLLDVLSVFVLRVSQPVEGNWDEGGASDVKETLTKRESRRTWLAGGSMGTAECIAVAEMILCEGGDSKEGIAAGRMALLLAMIGEREEVAQEVGTILLDLLDDVEGEAEVTPTWVLRRADEMADRLSMALPLLMVPIESQRLAARGPNEEVSRPVSDGRRYCQTARLDRLVQLVITSLQKDEGAASAVVVARQVARSHPRLIATHMLSLRALLAGHSMLRPSEFAQRNCTRLFVNVIGVIEAAGPHALMSPTLGAVLDELMGVFRQIVRHEAVLQPLLGRAAGLLLAYGTSSREGEAYLRRQEELLFRLAGWYGTVPELQRLLEFLSPSGTGLGFGLGLQDTEDRDAEVLASALRLSSDEVRDRGGGTAFDSTGAAHKQLMKSLEEAELVTKGDSGLHRLVRLERPLLDLMAAGHADVRDIAYRLVLRLGMQEPEAAVRLANRHLTAMSSADAGIQSSAIKFSPEVALLCAPAAPAILRLLLRLSRTGSDAAKEHLLRATRAGLAFHCQQAR